MTLPIAKPQAGSTGWHPTVYNMIDVLNAVDERIRDVVGSALVGGVGIDATVNDAGDTITIDNTNLADVEATIDAVAAAIVAGTNVTKTYDDTAGTITIDAAAAAGLDGEGVRDVMGTALVAGTGISITVNDGADTITVARTAPRVVTITDGATITPDADTTDIASVTFGGNRTMAAPSGTPVAGQKLMMRLKQDGTGSRVPTWNSIYRFAGGTAPTLTLTANKTDYLGFIYNAVDTKWDCVAERLNF